MTINITGLQDEVALRVAAIGVETSQMELLTLAKTLDQLFVLEQPSNYIPASSELVVDVQTHTVYANQVIPLSIYTTGVEISVQAKGGDGGLNSGYTNGSAYAAGGGGGSGAFVKDFPIGFVAGGTLDIKFEESQISVGGLIVESGETPPKSVGSRTVTTKGGDGGKVFLYALPVPEAADLVAYGLVGGDSGTNTKVVPIPIEQVNGHTYGLGYTSYHSTYGGGGGVGAPSYTADGGDGSLTYQAWNGENNDALMAGQGFGAGGGGNGGWNNATAQDVPGVGGAASPMTVKVTSLKPFGLDLSGNDTTTTKTYFTQEVSGSSLITVPINCTGKALVTMGAAGGGCPANNVVSNVSGGGSGAYVKDFEIGVGSTVNVVYGKTQKVGSLEVTQGQDGQTGSGGQYKGWEGGEGGIVQHLGIPLDESTKVHNGVKGGDSGYYNASATKGENFLRTIGTDIVSFAGGTGSTSANSTYGGSGGGGAASYGSEGGDGSLTYGSQGATPSGHGAGCGGDGGRYAYGARSGGAQTIITIKFEVES